MAEAEREGRILILGLDGADLGVVRPFAAQGQLPNLARLLENGAHGALRSTCPPMSPAAWTSFMTGMNPGKHGVPDFTVRRPGSYEVDFVNARYRQAPTVWRLLSDASRRVCVLSVPITFPPEPLNGIQISGLDTPGGDLADAQGMHPPELHRELQEKLGGYLLSPNLRARSGTPEELLQAVFRSLDRKLETARYLYAKEPWDCFMATIGETDAVSHRLWLYHDPRSPLHHAASRRHAGVDPLLLVYRRIDAHLGELLAEVRDDTTVFVMSDHGHAGNGDKAVHLNRWLEQRGLLRFDSSLARRALGFIATLAKRAGTHRLLPASYRKQLFRRTPLAGAVESWLRFSRLDWAATRVYSEETPYFPSIWINVKGREPQGCVAPGAEYERVRQQVIEDLGRWTDPETGQPLVRSAHRREDLYSGPWLERFPDIVIDWNLDRGYSYLFRSSRPGRPPVARIAERERAAVKSGDHRDDGLLIASGAQVRPGLVLGAHIMDLAPTFLYLLGLPVPEDMDGRVLTELLTPDFVRAHPLRRSEAAGAPPEPGAGAEIEPAQGDEAIRRRLRGLGYLELGVSI